MNRISMLRVAGLAIAIGSYAGCTSNPTDPPPQPPASQQMQLFPYETGNRWITRMRSYDRTGKLVLEKHDTNVIASSVTIGSETWYRFDVDGSTELVTNRVDGAWRRPHIDSAARHVFRYPARVGDTCGTYRSSPSIPATPMTNLIVTSIDSVVTVPAGTFRCIVYHMQLRGADGALIDALSSGAGVEWDYYYCIAPGVGMVKSGMFAKRWKPGAVFSPHEAHDELMSYQLKRPG